MSESIPEGWMAEKRYDTKRYHYIHGSRSLCMKFGFYTGPLMPVAKATKGAEDCAECFKRLQKRLAK